MGGVAAEVTHPVVTAEPFSKRRWGCPLRAHSREGTEGQVLRDTQLPASRISIMKLSQCPQPPALHLPSHLRIWSASGTVQPVLPPASPRGWDFILLPQRFLGAISRTLLFNQGIKACARQLSSPLQPAGVRLPAPLPGAVAEQEDVCGCKSEQSCCSALL